VKATSVRPFDDPLASHAASWRFRLYVAGQSPKSLTALMNLKSLCSTFLEVDCTIEVVDLLEHPQRAAADQILAIPTLVRLEPIPLRKVVGDLSDADRVATALDMRAP
jgi:circadian clock protein KaiB